MIAWALAHWPWLLLAWCLVMLFSCSLAAAAGTKRPAVPARRNPEPLRVLEDVGDELGAVVIQFPGARHNDGSAA